MIWNIADEEVPSLQGREGHQRKVPWRMALRIMSSQKSRERIPAQYKAHQSERVWWVKQKLGFWTSGAEYLYIERGRAGNWAGKIGLE